LEQQQGPPDTCVDRVADRVLDVGFHKARDKVVARPGRVGPHKDVVSEKARVVAGLVAYLVLRREGTDHLVQQLEVIVGVVRAGVTRTEHRPERLYGRVAPGAEWVKAITVLVGRCGVLLVGERSDKRGVEVDRDVAWWRCGPDDLP